MSFYLYGELGPDGPQIQYKFSQKQAIFEETVEPGTYYIRIANSSGASGYSLTNTFTPL